MLAAGVVFTTPKGEVLFLRRGADGDHPGEWCLPGGKVEEGESAFEAVRREAVEETGFGIGDANPPLIDRRTSAEGVDFSTFRHKVGEAFDVDLNGEHTEYVWAHPDNPPSPLHPAVAALLSSIAMDHKPDAIAFDEGSVRTYDRDGRLHVALSNISKAAINEYIGREIPGWKEFGIDPDKRYKLLRDPDELKKAAPTFNNLPILSRHVPVTADNHKPDLVIGSLGTDAEFEAPYLKNSKVFWAREAIDDIESEVKKELSSAYHYRADMTPGEYEGEQYDGVMRDIVGNHVALVRDGRAGSDVVVGDSAIPTIQELFDMSKAVLMTRKGALALGVAMNALQPKLAQDAKPDLGSVFATLTHKNFKKKLPAVHAALKKLPLAQDASIDDVIKLVDALESTEVVEGADTDPDSGLPVEATAPEAMDAGGEALKTFLTGKLSDEDVAKACAMIGGGAADAEAPPFTKKDGDKTAEDEDDDKKETVTKPAMDAAIKAAVKLAQDEATKTQQAIRAAERQVRPYIGELAMDAKTADDVYLATFKALNVDVTGVHPSAFPTILKMQPLPNSKKPAAPQLGMDAAASKDFESRYPQTKHIKVVG